MNSPIYGGIDAGGTHFKCLLGSSPEHVVDECRVAVGAPASTLAECAEFLRAGVQQYGPLQGLGIGSFGPVDLVAGSATYGRITSTPKPHWQNVDILGFFRSCVDCPVMFETDVNAALCGEHRWGAAQGLHSAVYVTVGTGIGAGAMVDGRLLHGALHVEAGHMIIGRRHGDVFAGSCPFHGDCLEGLASAPAIAQRWQQPADALPDDHEAWQLQAHYLASMCVNLALVYSPQRIILGGGVMQRNGLLTKIHGAYQALMNAYLVYPEQNNVADFIVSAQLGARAGALGALSLSQDPPLKNGTDALS